MKPKPNFTIEDLLKEAITERKEAEANLFTARDLAALWGLAQVSKTVYGYMDKLIMAGWQFIPAKKLIRDRGGRETSNIAYRVIPPNNKEPSE